MEAVSTNPEIQRECGLPGLCKHLTSSGCKGNTHAFVLSNIRRAKAICRRLYSKSIGNGSRKKSGPGETGVGWGAKQGRPEAEGQRQPGLRALLVWPSLYPYFCGAPSAKFTVSSIHTQCHDCHIKRNAWTCTVITAPGLWSLTCNITPDAQFTFTSLGLGAGGQISLLFHLELRHQQNSSAILTQGHWKGQAPWWIRSLETSMSTSSQGDQVWGMAVGSHCE